MKKLLSVVILSLLWAQSHAAAQDVTSVAMPMIELVGTNTVELGLISAYEFQRVAFKFRNPGETPVSIIRLTSTCPCISGSPETLTIQPKEEATVTLELNGALVKDAFKRGVWVQTTDPRNSRILLLLTGEIRPLFSGLPESPLVFRKSAPGESWTNSFTLKATETNFFLGLPTVQDHEKMRMTASITTNQGETASYTVTLVATPLDTGRNIVDLQIPVGGRPGLLPLLLRVQGRIGTELNLSPTRFALFSSKNPVESRFYVRTGEDIVDAKLVTITPVRDGVTFDILPSPRSKAHFVLRVTLTPEAIEKLLQEAEPKVSIAYPDYKSVDLTFTRGS